MFGLHTHALIETHTHFSCFSWPLDVRAHVCEWLHAVLVSEGLTHAHPASEVIGKEWQLQEMKHTSDYRKTTLTNLWSMWLNPPRPQIWFRLSLPLPAHLKHNRSLGARFAVCCCSKTKMKVWVNPVMDMDVAMAGMWHRQHLASVESHPKPTYLLNYIRNHAIFSYLNGHINCHLVGQFNCLGKADSHTQNYSEQKIFRDRQKIRRIYFQCSTQMFFLF